MELLFAVFVFGFIVYLLIKQKKYKENPALFKAILLLFIALLLSSIIYFFFPGKEKYILFLSGISIGWFILIISYNNISSVFRCNEKIDGIYKGTNTYYGGNGVSRHTVMFSYKFNGKRYLEQSPQSISSRDLKLLTVGNEYPIYVSSNEPWKFVLNRRVSFTDIMIFLFGLFCILIGLYALAL